MNARRAPKKTKTWSQETEQADRPAAISSQLPLILLGRPQGSKPEYLKKFPGQKVAGVVAFQLVQPPVCRL